MSAPPEVKRTPLHEIHEGLGANLVDFAGYLMPLRYGSETAEHVAPAHPGYDAVVDDRSEAYALLAVQGPKAQEILFRVTGAPLADLKYYAILAGEVAGIDALIGRTGYTGEDGFELFVSSGDA